MATPHPLFDARLQAAFDSLHWCFGCTLKAALHHPTRRRILYLIANYHHHKMETITPVSRIEHEAVRAAHHHTSGEEACPWPLDSSAGQLFLLLFEIEYEAFHTGQQEQVKHEALLAAPVFDDVNDACPYPFSTASGQLFKDHFLAARENMKKTHLAQAARAQSATETIA